ncbi:uncharacterized protein PG998_002701 [Apiospora kogelbergensis]|uniref:uncharacterized protein n=1 Tax=Apiospora kogelbergensis TaxID=1337665 RepID=UPI0031301855
MPPIAVALDVDEFQGKSMVPWFSYRVSMPRRPMPGLADEARRAQTPRLVLRPFVAADLDAFHELRSRPETQRHSLTRGRASRDREESRARLDALLADDGQRHWYVGAFLAATGELVGEAGLPDCVTLARSGWPEAEVLLKPEHWRQGIVRGWLDSWWALPREIRRHQLFPLSTGWIEPGEELVDGVGFGWEDTNEPAAAFFPEVLGRRTDAVYAEGFFEELDQRDGREQQVLRWRFIITNNPHGLDEYRVADTPEEAEESE